MILQTVLGKVKEFPSHGKMVEVVHLTWEEMGKRVLRKTTSTGRDVGIVLDTPLQHEDVLYAGEDAVIVVELLPTNSLVIAPKSMQEMALLCYHLGNRHASVFYQEGCIVTPYDNVLGDILCKLGFEASIEERRLSNALHASSRHNHH